MRNSRGGWLALLCGCAGAFGCGSDSSSATAEPDVDPVDITCETPAKFGCLIATQCHDFYTKASAELGRTRCEEENGRAYEGGCSDFFAHCCVVLTGANDLPEGFCINDDNPQSQTYETFCNSDPEPTFYCKR